MAWIEAIIKNHMKIRLSQSLTNRSISLGVDSAAMAITIISVPSTVANTPPQISGANVRSTFWWSSMPIPNCWSSQTVIDG